MCYCPPLWVLHFGSASSLTGGDDDFNHTVGDGSCGWWDPVSYADPAKTCLERPPMTSRPGRPRRPALPKVRRHYRGLSNSTTCCKCLWKVPHTIHYQNIILYVELGHKHTRNQDTLGHDESRNYELRVLLYTILSGSRDILYIRI